MFLSKTWNHAIQGEDKAETFQRIAALDFEFDEEDFGGVSIEARKFIESLFTRDPLKRATAKQCLHHDWIIKYAKNTPSIKIEPIDHRQAQRERQKEGWNYLKYSFR